MKINWSLPSMFFTIIMLNIWRVSPTDSIRGLLASFISFGLIGWWWRK